MRDPVFREGDGILVDDTWPQTHTCELTHTLVHLCTHTHIKEGEWGKCLAQLKTINYKEI